MPVAGSVVGQHTAAGKAGARERGSGHMKEARGRGAGLIRENGRACDAAVVVDRDVKELVTGAACLASAVAVDAIDGPHDAGQAFDVEMNQVAGPRVFVAHHGRRRVERVEFAQPGAAQDPAHRSRAQAELGRDPQPGPAQPDGLLDRGGRGRAGIEAGREERSGSESGPWSRYRRTHLAAVFSLTLKAAAAAFNVEPCSRTFFARAAR